MGYCTKLVIISLFLLSTCLFVSAPSPSRIYEGPAPSSRPPPSFQCEAVSVSVNGHIRVVDASPISHWMWTSGLDEAAIEEYVFNMSKPLMLATTTCQCKLNQFLLDELTQTVLSPPLRLFARVIDWVGYRGSAFGVFLIAVCRAAGLTFNDVVINAVVFLLKLVITMPIYFLAKLFPEIKLRAGMMLVSLGQGLLEEELGLLPYYHEPIGNHRHFD